MIAAQLDRFEEWLTERGTPDWRASWRREFVTELLGQVECGLTTHAFGDCGWCGARV